MLEKSNPIILFCLLFTLVNCNLEVQKSSNEVSSLIEQTINSQKDSIYSHESVMATAIIIPNNEVLKLSSEINIQLKSIINQALKEGLLKSNDFVCFQIKKTHGKSILDKYKNEEELYMVILDDGFISNYISLRSTYQGAEIKLPFLSCYYFIFTKKENGDFEFRENGAAG